MSIDTPTPVLYKLNSFALTPDINIYIHHGHPPSLYPMAAMGKLTLITTKLWNSHSWEKYTHFLQWDTTLNLTVSVQNFFESQMFFL